ncbi:MAG: hypothetical protein HC822_12225 [Oscillochloris sp.]|nr:hypothetical protein [Oscillochloris sp.]
MSVRSYVLRVLVGLCVLVLLVPTLFTLAIPYIHTAGASRAEAALSLPGDDILTKPQLSWIHAISIDAPPEQVWPWIAQMGDRRGGFYSFTFIENRVGSITGAENYQVVYRNAERIMPEWQNPQPGDPLIEGALKVSAVEPGRWLLADSVDPAALGWTWLWKLVPLDDGERTRLIVRMRIQTPAQISNPLMSVAFDAGGFVMEQRMLHGIKLRAEGGAEPAWAEGVEIGLWLAALICGLIAAGLFVALQDWLRPLAVALAALLVLFVLTFVQPALWVRLLCDLALVAGLGWAAVLPIATQRRPVLVGR